MTNSLMLPSQKKRKLVHPLGHDSDGDEEEAQLEEFLFGTTKGHQDEDIIVDEEPDFQPAWEDQDDGNIQVSLTSNKRSRKLRNDVLEDVVEGSQYEAKLRREFQRINPPPGWAATARKNLQRTKQRSEGDLIIGEVEDDGVDEVLASTNGVLATGLKGAALPQGVLRIERLRDANQSAPSEGSIKALAFHPSRQAPILFTASSDRRLRLFNIDGHTNPHIQTVHVPSLPITNAMFHPTGSSVLMTGNRPYYYTFDLQSGSVTCSPRALWGTTFSSKAANDQLGDRSMSTCAFDPSGEVLAVAGRAGSIHLVDWKSGAGQVVGSIRMNAPVKALHWCSPGTSGRPQLMTLGQDAQVYIWDVGQRKCVRRWADEGAYGSGSMTGDLGGKFIAIGSKTGLVNVYGTESTLQTQTKAPKPLRTLSQLTTASTTLRFNRDSQLLAVASDLKKDQLRLIHFPSLSAFSNWPTSATPLGRVTALDFSAGGEYLAVGNDRGRATLYSLPHFLTS